MKVSMTNGTPNYLAKLDKKHPETTLFFMQDQDKTVAYHEGEPGIFEEGRDYETVDAVGEMKPEGFVVMNNIPVSDEGRPVFEDRFKNRKGGVEQMEGFQALRILRPLKGNTYVVLTQWRNENDFEDWKNSQSFEQAHQNSGPKHTKKPSFIDGDAYITKYRMVQFEEE
ncbi:heme-degrading monooxygenase HmoB [Thalassobacillus devorans]|uniref:Heme-degrading monooxygenase HmoB n=1 Tax=Thalassobacillus devorans TaxID=279813 RepID=A0ABQ1NGV4_9BACI|nr:antibiotic biosynthesis monooxygenase [Thalassobacillus devorans]NIK26988.1 heme-degrading monooxygenase HmoA [Thalassobacillus devorans]GGC74020.1 heme-degrading monooxygenase HmoB [Thalassobacillus devorans]